MPEHVAALDHTQTIAPGPSPTKTPRCTVCRGFGWSVAATPDPPPGLDRRSTLSVCRCVAGGNLWRLALEDGDAVLALMGLDAQGHIASTDGLFAKSPVRHGDVLAWRASQHTDIHAGVRS